MHKLSCAEIYKIAPDVILTNFKDRYEVELDDVIEMNNAYIELADNQRVFSIIDMEKKFSHISNEALKYLSNEASFVIKYNLLRGSVVIVDSLPGRILANFFVRLKKHSYPIKVVSSFPEAKKWIESTRSQT